MKKFNLAPPALCALALLFTSTAGVFAQDDVGPAGALVPYSQDFETLDLAVVSDVKFENLWTFDNWRFFGNSFTSDRSGYNYGYGPFRAPNNLNGEEGEVFFAASISQVLDDVPTTSGSRYLNFFSDYNNAEHRDGSGSQINSLIYQDRDVAAGDVGETWDFKFDYRNADLGFGVADDTTGISEANAFVKVLDPDNGFAEIDGSRFDTSEASNTFTAGLVSFEITSAHVGKLLQFGFENFAANESPSGVYYDTLSFAPASAAILGDFDNDGDVDNLDIDAYVGNLGVAATGELAQLDLNGDNQVTIADHALLVTQLATANGIAGTNFGDANLDGVVDVLGDAAALVNNLGQSPRGWADGDFNADGAVDVLGDAAILVDNLGASNSTGGSVATSAVPEPGTTSLLGLAVTALAVRRRR